MTWLVPGRVGSFAGGERGDGGGGGGMSSESDRNEAVPRRGVDGGVVGDSRCTAGSILDFFLSVGSGESGVVSGDGGDLRLNGDVDGFEEGSDGMEGLRCIVQSACCWGMFRIFEGLRWMYDGGWLWGRCSCLAAVLVGCWGGVVR